MAKLNLQSGYIADAIIETKKNRFNEDFTTMDEVNIVKQVVERRIQEENLKVQITNGFFDNYFNIINGVITKNDKEFQTLKIFISGSNIRETNKIRETIYDENLICLCLCEIKDNQLKLNNVKNKYKIHKFNLR